VRLCVGGTNRNRALTLVILCAETYLRTLIANQKLGHPTYFTGVLGHHRNILICVLSLQVNGPHCQFQSGDGVGMIILKIISPINPAVSE